MANMSKLSGGLAAEHCSTAWWPTWLYKFLRTIAGMSIEIRYCTVFRLVVAKDWDVSQSLSFNAKVTWGGSLLTAVSWPTCVETEEGR